MLDAIIKLSVSSVNLLLVLGLDKCSGFVLWSSIFLLLINYDNYDNYDYTRGLDLAHNSTMLDVTCCFGPICMSWSFLKLGLSSVSCQHARWRENWLFFNLCLSSVTCHHARWNLGLCSVPCHHGRWRAALACTAASLQHPCWHNQMRLSNFIHDTRWGVTIKCFTCVNAWGRSNFSFCANAIPSL